ncbi:MAG: radical SAM protein [Oscillospiraceae bacterium]
MTITTKQEIVELLTMPWETFQRTVVPAAKQTYIDHRNNELVSSGMLGFSNICKNRCLYCGMRAGSPVERYRIKAEDVIASARTAREMGFGRMFVISGEDLGYGYDNILEIIRGIKALGLHLSLACGEFSPEQYQEFADLGVDEYVIKFEMSQREVFDRLNPSTSFDKRMASIEAVKKAGMKLASGNIVDYPGHTPEMIAEDILLMKDLDISWAPVIPYMPAAGTPLAAEGGRGDIYLNLREIAILRLMMPSINITAQQPGRDMTKGLADDEGNLLALAAGANMLFADFLPDALVGCFSVIDNRFTLGLEHIRNMASRSGMTLV